MLSQHRRCPGLFKLLGRPALPDEVAVPPGVTRVALGDTPHDGPSSGHRRAGAAIHGQVMRGMISSATMLATLIIGLIAGPAVSL